MTDNNRFNSLENKSAPLPEKVVSAISRLNRFESLEIAGAHLAGPAKAATPDRLLCPSCGQANERSREICWACYKPLNRAAKPIPEEGQEVCVVLDGVSYRSSDPNLPDDIRELIARIRKEGYSGELLAEWQNWRVMRNREKLAQADLAPLNTSGLDRVQAFKGQRVSVLRLDGVVYKSDDLHLPAEIREIFGFIETEGITPALMQHLRLYGTKVKYRPLSTPQPSDGDLHFWDAARKAFRRP